MCAECLFSRVCEHRSFAEQAACVNINVSEFKELNFWGERIVKVPGRYKLHTR